MSRSPLRLAVVGHANTGKTSLLQTLLRRRDFGEVSPSPGTTLAVEAGEVADGDGVIAVLLDTPGLEDSEGLRDAIESTRIDRRDDGRTLLDRFLASLAAADNGDLGQEAASVRAALSADVLLYAIDVRGEPMEKHRDELAVLVATARPLVAILNYTAHPDAHPTRWRSECARHSVHTTVEFDAVVYDDAGEQRLLNTVKALDTVKAFVPDLDTAIERWKALRERERQEVMIAATDVAAEFLVTAAAAVVVTDPKERNKTGRRVAVEEATDLFLDELRQRETGTRDRIAEAFGFFGDEARAVTFDVEEALGGVDFLSRASLKRVGLWTAAGAGRRGDGGRGGCDGRRLRRRRVPGRIHGPRSYARRGRSRQPEGASPAPGTGGAAAPRSRRGGTCRPGPRHHPGHARPRSRGGRVGLDRGGGEGEPRGRHRPGLAGIVGKGARAGRLERAFPAAPERRRWPGPRRDRQESGSRPCSGARTLQCRCIRHH